MQTHPLCTRLDSSLRTNASSRLHLPSLIKNTTHAWFPELSFFSPSSIIVLARCSAWDITKKQDDHTSSFAGQKRLVLERWTNWDQLRTVHEYHTAAETQNEQTTKTGVEFTPFHHKTCRHVEMPANKQLNWQQENGEEHKEKRRWW